MSCRLKAALVVLALAVPTCSPPVPEQRTEEVPAAVPESAIVRVGLERLAAGEDEILRGKRVGLVVHAASVTAEGWHAIDVLRNRGLEVVRLFAPEHGLRGRKAAGEPVIEMVDPGSDLPVVSLYGAKKRPAPEDLADLDALVIDLQDAGVRFYTYVSTMMLCLEAAAEVGLEIVVLDRPNPLGGERIEGPISASRQLVPESLVNMAPGPLLHGLTLGEMAGYVNANLQRPARLTIIPMLGWERRMVWADTGRSWVSPSPNLRSADAAVAYPGTAMLEATNVSEGRGTQSPFLLIGAPWLDTAQVHVAVPGFALEPTRFIPHASAAAPNPKFQGQTCVGFRIAVTDAALAEPYRLGLSLVTELMKLPDFEWRRDGEALTWLVGTHRLFEHFQAGKSVEQIVAADQADHRAWRQARSASLLY